MMRRQTLAWFALLPFVLPATAMAGADAAQLGRVGGLEGRALGILPGHEARVLECGDPIHEGERVITEGDSRVVVITDPGPEVHLAASSQVVLRRSDAGELMSRVLHGGLRLLDGRAQPRHFVATPAGYEAVSASDVELVHSGPDSLRICQWSPRGLGTCHQLGPMGRKSWLHDAIPSLDLTLQDVCAWKREIHGLFRVADFATPPPVSSGPGHPAFEPEPEFEPACQGDECSGGPPIVPDPMDPEPFGDPRVLTVAPPPIGIPDFQAP